MDGSDIMQWLDEASQFSEPGAGVTRVFLSDEHQQVLTWLAGKAEILGLAHRIDDSGNFLARKPAATESAPTLLLGSHQDTVREGGKYDGMLGVVLPLIALAELPPLEFHVELVAFGDEEGTRFNSTLVGSSALAGSFDFSMLQRTDDAGTTMEQAMRDFGLQPGNIPALARRADEILGFIEVHIEQGPVLESKNLPVGIVTSLTGIERHLVTVHGKAGHAGTTPMELRKDALVKAARVVGYIDQLCRDTANLVGVVGELNVEPNAVNVIPARVTLTVELRSPDVDTRLRARDVLYAYLEEQGEIDVECSYSKDGIEQDPALMAGLADAVKAEGVAVERLFSGAGHDGLAMINLTRCGMLFVRCKDGLSHHPDEAITAADCSVALRVLQRFIIGLSEQQTR